MGMATKNHGKGGVFPNAFVTFYDKLLKGEKVSTKMWEKRQFFLTFFDLPVKLSVINFSPHFYSFILKRRHERWIFRHCTTVS